MSYWTKRRKVQGEVSRLLSDLAEEGAGILSDCQHLQANHAEDASPTRAGDEVQHVSNTEDYDYNDGLNERQQVFALNRDDALFPVAISWLVDDDHCFWPPYASDSRLRQAAEDQEEPGERWSQHPVRVLCKCGMLTL